MAIPRAKKKRLGSMSRKDARKSVEDGCREVQIIMSTAMFDVMADVQRDVQKMLDDYTRFLPQYLKNNIHERLDPMGVAVDTLELSAKYSQYYDDNLVKLRDFANSVYKSSNGEIDLRGRKYGN